MEERMVGHEGPALIWGGLRQSEGKGTGKGRERKREGRDRERESKENVLRQLQRKEKQRQNTTGVKETLMAPIALRLLGPECTPHIGHVLSTCTLKKAKLPKPPQEITLFEWISTGEMWHE